MEVNLGDFKAMFVVGSLYGINTVSLSTLEQSMWKIIYSVFLITVHIVEIIVYFYNDQITPVSSIRKIVKLYMSVFPVYSLIVAIVDYKSNITVALSLEAIEATLEKNNFKVPGKTMCKAMSVSLVVINIVMQSFRIVHNTINNSFSLPMTRFVTNIQLVGNQLVVAVSIMMFQTKIVMIQKAITKGFTDVIYRQNEQHTTTGFHRNRGRRNRRVQTEKDKKWALLTEIHGSLDFTENMVRNSFWMQIIWNRLLFEVALPIAVFIWDFSGIGWYFVARAAFQFVMIVFTCELLTKEKKAACSTITTSEQFVQGISRKQIKRQLLANIHRGRVPFSCLFFDVDYSLLATVLENLIFVVTVLAGNSKNKV